MSGVRIFICAASMLATSHGCFATPWRLQDQIDSQFVKFSGQSLIRYESLNGQYRGMSGGSDQVVVLRNQLKAQLILDNFTLVGEFMDARQNLADHGSPISTGVVNTAEFIQTYVGYKASNVFEENDELSLKLGRQTMDFGSRRLIASTRFRATENTFTGLRVDWNYDDSNITLYYFLPVFRLPNDDSSLLNNEHNTDIETSDIKFYGASMSTPSFLNDLTIELAALRLTENDSKAIPTSNFNITTLGGRMSHPPRKGKFNCEAEAYYQWGKSHSSSLSTDTKSLNHKAWYMHLEVGYSFDVIMSPRLQLLYDLASGDEDPSDQENNRFHSLYGVTAFEFGPTGIYGAFARENLKTPGVRLSIYPLKNLSAEFTLRHMSLASSKDGWAKGKLRDVTGDSGTDLGDQLEAKVVWNVMPGNIKIIVGFTNLFAGEFSERVAGDSFDTHYGFLQTIINF